MREAPKGHETLRACDCRRKVYWVRLICDAIGGVGMCWWVYLCVRMLVYKGVCEKGHEEGTEEQGKQMCLVDKKKERDHMDHFIVGATLPVHFS